MKKLCILLMTMYFMLVLTVAASASLVNGGFESIGFTGWTKSDGAGGSTWAVGSAHTGSSGTPYSAVEGTNFVMLSTSYYAGIYTKLYQTVSLSAGQSLEGMAAFDYGQDGPDDNAYVKIFDSGGNLVDTPWDEYGKLNPASWDGPWTSWSWTAATGGDYTLEFGVANAIDSFNYSWALFDAVKLTPVPIPTTIMLLGSGLICFAGFRRKFRKS